MGNPRRPARNVFERHRGLTLSLFVLLVLVLADFVLGGMLNARSIRSPHGFYHHTLDPLATSVETFGGKRARYFTNSLGMRDRSNREVQLADSRRRILILGDSFAEGVGFRYPQTAIGRLAAALPDAEILNAAVVSFSPRLSGLRLRHLVEVVGLEVDEVVLFVDISDAQDEYLYQGFEPHEISPATLLGWRLSRALRSWSYLGAQVARWRRDPEAAAWFDDGVFPELHANYAASRTPDFWSLRAEWPGVGARRLDWLERGLSLQEASIERIIWYCEEHALPLTIVVYPWPGQLGPQWLEGFHVDPVRELASRYGIQLVDLYTAFAEAGEPADVREQFFIPGDVHWNRKGNAFVADHLLRALGSDGGASRPAPSGPPDR